MAKKQPVKPPASHPKLQIEYLPRSKISGYHRNSRTHSDEQIAAIVESIKTFGFNNPILIDDQNVIVAGHGRFAAATKMGFDPVPTVRLGHLTDAQRRAYVIADNKIADMSNWDSDMLDLEIAELSNLGADLGFDLTAIGFNAEEIGQANEVSEHLMAEPTKEDDQVRGMYDDVGFKGEGEWDWPILRRDMILTIPEKLSTWAGHDISENFPPPFMYQWASDSTRGIPWQHTIIGFYVDDIRFNCWFDSPRLYCDRVLANGIIGAISPNFSTYGDTPRAVRIHAGFKSRWVGRYMQEAGIKIIPDVDAQPSELEQTCEGLKGIPFIASQCQIEMNTAERVRQNKFYDYIIDTLKPESMIFVAPQERMAWFPALKRTRVVRVEPRALLRGKKAREKVKPKSGEQ